MKASEFSLAKTKKVSRWVYYLFQALFYLNCIYILALVILGMAKILFPEFSPISLNITWIDFLRMVITQVPVLFIIRVVALLLGDVSKGVTPFSGKQISRLRWIGILFLIDALFTTLLSSGFFNAVTAGMFEMSFVSDSGQPGNYIPIDVSSIFLALVAFSLSLVFSYGFQLQRQSEDIV